MKNVKLISLGLAMLICFVTKAQEKTITGTVSDASAPLPGVTIVNKNSKANASTNFDGKYLWWPGLSAYITNQATRK